MRWPFLISPSTGFTCEMEEGRVSLRGPQHAIFGGLTAYRRVGFWESQMIIKSTVLVSRKEQHITRKGLGMLLPAQPQLSCVIQRKNDLLANRKEGLTPNPMNGFQVIVSHACLGFARMGFTTFSHRKITAVT